MTGTHHRLISLYQSSGYPEFQYIPHILESQKFHQTEKSEHRTLYNYSVNIKKAPSAPGFTDSLHLFYSVNIYQ